MAYGDLVKTMQVGLRTGAASSNDFARCDETFAQAIFQSHGKYHDAVKRGRVYSGATAATGVAPGTTISTTAAISLYNPVGSGFNLHVLRASMAYVSGTLGAGSVYWLANVLPGATATTGTAITMVNNLFGGAAGVGRLLTTATIPAPTILRPFCGLGASLASTAVSPWQVFDDVDSEFVVTPGCTLSLHAQAAAGSTPLVIFGMTWEEFAQ
jgi:hypothetical protein